MAGPFENEIFATCPIGICAPVGVAISTRAEIFYVVAKVALVADVHRVTLRDLLMFSPMFIPPMPDATACWDVGQLSGRTLAASQAVRIDVDVEAL